jgi:methionyl-tRNA formyltransferase
MKIIFAGTPQFAATTLQALLASEHEIVAVYTQPDRPAGRGQKLQASPVKELAQQHQLPICQPQTLRQENEQTLLKNWQADLMIVVAYGLIIPKAVLETPKFGCINVHASLLPRWRGAAPIQRAILAGDAETGVTIMQMDEGLDTGSMLYKVTTPIANSDTSQTLHDRLATLGATALLKTLTELSTMQSETQIDADSCYAKKITKEEAAINWQDSAVNIDRLVRAFNPWPIAYSALEEKTLRIWQTEVINTTTNEHTEPGTIIRVEKTGIDVATGEGVLRLLKIQLPGGKCLAVQDVLNAHAKWFAIGQKFNKIF